MTELIFNITPAGRYISEPVLVEADFALHLTFDLVVGNRITVFRSVDGNDFAKAYETDYDEAVFDRTFTGVGGGLYIKVKCENEPSEGAIS